MLTLALQPNPTNAEAAPAAGALRALLRRIEEFAAGSGTSAEEVLELAARYESSQPSYAADLRAAAALLEGDEG